MPKEQEEVSHNAERWNKLKAMRDRRDGVTPPPEVKVTPATQALDQNRDDAGKFVQSQEAAAAAAAEKAATEKAQADQAAAEAAAKAAAEAAAQKAKEATAPPGTVEIELEVDGEKAKVHVDKSLADAFKKADEVRKEAAKVEEAGKGERERQKLKDELREELKKEFAPKQAQETDADKVLKEAERVAALPKSPSDELFASDPVAWRKQQAAYEKSQVEEAVRRSKEETLEEVRRQQHIAIVEAEKQGRLILREQFYRAYPQFSKASELVDVLLEKEISTVIASGKISKPLPPKEAESLRAVTFANVATAATGKLAKIMGAAREVVVPEPPKTVQSAPVHAAAPKAEAPPTEREKFQKGSVSALLAAHQKSKANPQHKV